MAHLLEHVAVELLAQSGVPRDQARGQTGIPRGADSQAEQIIYRLHFYGASSLQCMEELLHQAARLMSACLMEQA